MRRVFLVLWVTIAGLTASVATLHAKDIQLTPAQMRVAAAIALQQNRAEISLDFSSALLQRDPNDFRALLLRAQAARKLGRFDMAKAAARKTWDLAETPEGRYAAALIYAQVLASKGARTRAQFWLRRAVQNAPSQQLRARAVRDFRYVQSRNPFRTDLHFSIQPSSNINNGSKSDTLVIGGLAFDLSGDARALSGIEFSYGFSTMYKKKVAPDWQWRLGFRLDARNYALSAEAKRQAPGQSASDYAFVTTEISFGTTKALDQGRGALDFNLAIGRNWYGANPLGDFARISVSRMFSKSATTRSRYQVTATRQLRKDNSQRSSTQIALAGYWTKALNNGGVLRWNLGAQNTSSASASVAHSGISAGASLSPEKGLFGARVTYSLNLAARRYDLPSFGVLRSDNKASAGVSLFFNKVNYYGFAPTLNFTATRNQSNISLYDTTEYGLSVGFRSTF